jgi:hypothetical protein
MCERFERMIVVQAEEELPPRQEAALARHLAGCARCRAFAADLRALRQALPGIGPSDPGEEFFAAARERVWREHRRAVREATGAGLWARLRTFFAGLGESLALERREAALAVLGVAAAAILAVVLWPRAVQVPARLPQEAVAPLSSSEESPDVGDLSSEIASMSRDELQALAPELVIDAGDVNLGDPDEETDGIEGQIESLSPVEVRALELQIELATREVKGA